MAEAGLYEPSEQKTTSIGVAAAGLTSDEARRRLAAFGPNAVEEPAPTHWRAYLTKFWSPIAWLLELAMLIETGLGRYGEGAVIAGLLLFNATLGFIQEGRAGAALANLKKRLAPTAIARRDGKWVKIAAVELVPGDTIRLSLGAIVPADARMLSGLVMADQSMLTGESVPVDASQGDMVYAGAMVRRGQAIGEVTATGPRTYFGRAAELVRRACSASTEQAAIFAATRNLAFVNATVAIGIVIYAYATAMPPSNLVPLGLTVLLATIPAALPATFTLSAAFGAQTLARRGVLLTRLSAVHEAAAVDLHLQHADQEDRDRAVPGYWPRDDGPGGNDSSHDGFDAGDKRRSRHVAHHRPRQPVTVAESMAHAQHHRGCRRARRLQARFSRRRCSW